MNANSRILLAVAACPGGYYSPGYGRCITLPTLGSRCNTVTDVIIVLDSSGSVGAANFDVMKQFARDFSGLFVLSTRKVGCADVCQSTADANYFRIVLE